VWEDSHVPESLDQGFEVALAYDAAFVPRYARHFGERLLASLRFGPRPSVLDLACRTGYPCAQIAAGARDAKIVALDRESKFMELARARVGVDVGRRVFFKQGGCNELRFSDEVFSHVVCNLIDRATTNRSAALAEARRVLIPDGQIAFTLPLQGSFVEVIDLLHESATRLDLPRLHERVEQYAAKFPTAEQVRDELRACGFDHVSVDTWSFTLEYNSSRDLFEDPVSLHATLQDWRWCADAANDADAVLAALRHAVDTYFTGRCMTLSVHGGAATGFRSRA
jgi:ubiquinone/menaquinone biosynthesis C-methylase UbiE